MKRNILFILTMLIVLAGCAAQGAEPTGDRAAKGAVNYDILNQYQDLDTGIRLSYYELGKKDGEPLVLIHGATDSYISFSQIASVLVDRGYHIYIPELRGHGQSDKPEEGPYTAPVLAADLNALMEKLNIQNAHVVGHSLGSMVAQEIAIVNPDKVKSLTLISSTAKMAGNPVVTWLLEGDEEEFPGLMGMDEIPADFVADWTSSSNNDSEFIERTYSHALSLPYHSWIHTFAGALEADNTSRLASVTVPTQIIWGTADDLFSKEDQMALINALGSSCIVFRQKQGIGHNTHWEGTLYQEVAADIDQFIQSQN